MIVQYRLAWVGCSHARHTPHTAANAYMAFRSSGPRIPNAAAVVFATSSTRQSIALLSGFSRDPAHPPK